MLPNSTLVISGCQVSFQNVIHGILETINYEDALRPVVNATDILRENFVTSATHCFITPVQIAELSVRILRKMQQKSVRMLAWAVFDMLTL